MEKINSKLRQLKFRLKHDYFSLENVVLFLAILLCLVWTYQSIVSMTRNWELTERLATERKNLELISVEVEAAELENEYYRSEEYQELAARRLANKQLAGEKMVYLPENSERARAKHRVNSAEVIQRGYTNFEKWMMYLFPSK